MRVQNANRVNKPSSSNCSANMGTFTIMVYLSKFSGNGVGTGVGIGVGIGGGVSVPLK